jgi:nucleoside diphosphate kinase
MQRRDGSWTYILVTPDGLLTGSLPWLLDKVRSVGLDPIAGRLICVKPETMLNIYAPPTRNRPASLPSDRAFDLWFGLGPGCVLVLHRNGNDACAAMLEAKGETIPTVARPDTIRYAGENGLMNLVHCPDNEVGAVNELAQIVGRKCAFDLQQLAMSPNDKVRQLTVDSLGDSLPAHCGREALSMPLIVNKIRLRIVQQMAIRGASSNVILSVLTEARSALRWEHDEIIQMPTSAGRASVAQAHNDQLHGLLIDIAGQLEDAATEEILSRLSASIIGPQSNWLGTLAGIRACGIYLSETESAALELSTHSM